ncbi:uncharacterized protein [Porites lutea]|uniref:uncharacterized protein n=1 Tax=Porites lutea TaxID=51062 RepID=UPI003CC67F7B
MVIRHQTALNHFLNTLSRWLPLRLCCREEYNNNEHCQLLCSRQPWHKACVVIVTRRWPGAGFFKFSIDHCQVALVKAKKETKAKMSQTPLALIGGLKRLCKDLGVDPEDTVMPYSMEITSRNRGIFYFS